MNFKKTAVYPGTFDPITLGHVDIIKRTSLLFDKVIIAVAKNLSKAPAFSIEERVTMVNEEVNNNNMKNVEARAFNGLLVEFVKNERANIIIRGLRAVADFEYEFQMSFVNRTLDSDIETIFLPATENVHFISSSFVKEITRLGGNTENLVSKNIQYKLFKRFKHVQNN
jgi:pantetheine-phosphate adenylyltransferase